MRINLAFLKPGEGSVKKTKEGKIIGFTGKVVRIIVEGDPEYALKASTEIISLIKKWDGKWEIV